MRWPIVILVCCFLTSCTQQKPPAPPPVAAEAPPLRILAWNVELNRADADVIAAQLNEDHYTIDALSEVTPSDSDILRLSLPARYQSTLGASGRNIRLMVFVDTDRCELQKSWELDELNDGNHRSPLVCRLKDKADGKVFLLVTNHLARGDENLRKKQATGPREWARDQTLRFAFGAKTRICGR